MAERPWIVRFVMETPYASVIIKQADRRDPRMGVPNPLADGAPDKSDTLVEDAARLRLTGLTQQKIAERLGVSQPYVSMLLARARDTWRENVSSAYEEHVAEAVARLEMLLASLEPHIARSDWKAIDTAIRIEDRRARLLGLDHGDRISTAMVRVEEQKVRIMSAALTSAIESLPPEVQASARSAFFAALRAEQPGGETRVLG